MVFAPFFSLFFFFFSLNFISPYCYIFKLRDPFFCHVQSTTKSTKAVFTSVTVFLNCGILFDSFLEFSSLCLYYLCILVCCLLFSLDFSVLIIVCLFFNPCLIIPIALPYLTLIMMLAKHLQTVFLSFSMPNNFMLKSRHDIPVITSYGSFCLLVCALGNCDFLYFPVRLFILEGNNLHCGITSLIYL